MPPRTAGSVARTVSADLGDSMRSLQIRIQDAHLWISRGLTERGGAPSAPGAGREVDQDRPGGRGDEVVDGQRVEGEEEGVLRVPQRRPQAARRAQRTRRGVLAA